MMYLKIVSQILTPRLIITQIIRQTLIKIIHVTRAEISTIVIKTTIENKVGNNPQNNLNTVGNQPTNSEFIYPPLNAGNDQGNDT